jgi:hypothetical protein
MSLALWMMHPEFHDQRERLIAGRGLPKKNARIQTAHLPGRDAMRKANVIKMYEGLSPNERTKLRAQRARRGLDVIDLFHTDVREVFEALTPRQKAGILDVMVMTNQYRKKLRGIANGTPSEL